MSDDLTKSEKSGSEIESKKAELDKAQRQVELFQASVDSCVEKFNKVDKDLLEAKTALIIASENQNTLDEMSINARELLKHTELAHKEITRRNIKSKQEATEIDDIVTELIYNSEMINNLANLLIKKKSISPLMTDELVDSLRHLGTDANNSVALSLTALRSSTTSEISSIGSQEISELAIHQAKTLLSEIDGNEGNRPKIKQFLQSIYDQSKSIISALENEYTTAKSQLSEENLKLNQAKLELSALILV